MADRNTLLLYVKDPQASGRFYAGLLRRDPFRASPTFVLFVLPSGLALDLRGKDVVRPAPVTSEGGSELGFPMKSAAEVDAAHADWLSKGAIIALPPTDLEFGRSFVALDPDGHRLRVYALAEEM
ncbi:VOC family protein [Chelatococcus sp. GCM10030263]|uniref:VOC family protein n=1 Tax=Chelatococcus sp. GCM10030263 TaxID=3273387 RepID=UPI00360826FE